MAWRVSFRPSALRELEKLPNEGQRRVLAQLERCSNDPRQDGAPMKVGRRQPRLWRYRVGPYRIVCHLREEGQTVVVLRIAHRRDAYR